MDCLDDFELLSRYLTEGSQLAFTELVRRHLPLVYRSALRQTYGDSVEAQEITQAVFIRLARKASSLLQHPTLSGWLHTTVYFTASENRRAARRRSRHEQQASHMLEISSGDTPLSDWPRVQRVIDEALHRLDSKDRDAVLMRFFENSPFADIAIRLGVKEDTARMRVSRALARLRENLSSQGIHSTETALLALLASEAGAAPAAVSPELAAAVGKSSFAAAQATASTGLVAQLMSLKKSILVTAIIIGAFAVGVGSAFFLQRKLWFAKEQILKLQTENDSLRDRLTSALAANSKRPATAGFALGNAQDPEGRLNAIHSQVRLREVSRDALPTTVAHPLKFRGYDTPMHAVESFVWASYHSDAEALSRAIYLDDAARAAVEKIRATLAPDVQARYPTGESLIALCIAYDAIRYPGPNSEDIFIDAPEPNYHGPADFSLTNGHSYHKTAEGWKYNFPARAVTGFVNNIVHPKTP
jgi:RNA polymerase sigma factor (sigma-70 family)